ncbi:alanine racemase [Pandoraea anhela]|uniref:Amino acid deaminase n=1 Tax=Pandoraea anhela TaxID=2508295 RepID=A0A5E4WRF1_9BURK|nr:alanine racemase [Pandoraea anhela]VVE26359.1 amino acid deaminase [Pandoraea anhela]
MLNRNSEIPLRLSPYSKGVPDALIDVPRERLASLSRSAVSAYAAYPVAVLKQSVLEKNRAWMRQYVEITGASLAPHGKTSMSPELFEYLDHGATWGLTLATWHQVRAARAHGVSRIILANVVGSEYEADWYLDALRSDPSFDFYCYVDSMASVEVLSRAAQRQPLDRPLKVLLELGYAGGRTGCRDDGDAINIARAVQDTGGCLTLAGVAGFEGLIPGATPAQRLSDVTAFVERIRRIAKRCDRKSLFAGAEVVLSAGGSAFYDVVIRILRDTELSRPTRVVTRSGCFLSHDVGMYEALYQHLRERDPLAPCIPGTLEPALEVWGQVLSAPEPGWVIVNAGKRDFGTDAGPPTARFVIGADNRIRPFPAGAEIVATSDQHAHLRVPPGHGVQVGDRVGFGVSHPCTTFDKWQAIYVVDDDYVIQDIVQTCF